MSTPQWNAPVLGSPYQAGQITQFLGTHACAYAYQGTSVASQGSTGTNFATNTGAAQQWWGIPFTLGAAQTSISRVDLLALSLAGSGADVRVSLRASSGGLPSGSDLIYTILPADFLGIAAFTATQPVSVPLPITGLTAAATYFIVLAGTTDTANYDNFTGATATGKTAAVSSNGTSWALTTSGNCPYFNVWTGYNGVLRNTWEDSGLRWTGLNFGASNNHQVPPTIVYEYTGALRSVRSATTSGGLTTAWT